MGVAQEAGVSQEVCFRRACLSQGGAIRNHICSFRRTSGTVLVCCFVYPSTQHLSVGTTSPLYERCGRTSSERLRSCSGWHSP